jgi:Peptidoglycan-binding protein, CsiV
MIKRQLIQLLLATPISMGSVLLAPTVLAAEAADAPIERWYQIEMTVFTHEASPLDQELWSPGKLSLGFPENLQRLGSVSDYLQLDDWTVLSPAAFTTSTTTPAISSVPQVGITTSNPAALTPPLPGAQLLSAPILVGPLPFAPAESFRLPDLAREGFFALPPEAHRLTATNRALNQSAQYRILFHNAWRQPIPRRNAAAAIGIVGGRQYSEHSELEGSVIFYFNNAEDRLIFNGNLWLSSFNTQDNSTEEWNLPVIPGVLVGAGESTSEPPQEYFVNRILQLREVREMRELELHYLDHPALGVLVQITPYTPPAPVVVEPEPAPELLQEPVVTSPPL